MPAETQKVLVTGATGAQGGSVARHLLDSGRFTVRALTRNPDSEAASALRQAGAEVVGGSLDDPQSLRDALAGCWGAFGVTNYWEHFDKEFEHGRNLIDAVADAGLRHLILSTLPSPSRLTGGKLEVPHFETKARVQDYAREKNLRACFVHVAFYYENFIHFFPPRKQPDGSYVFGFPQGDTRLAAVAVEDLGGILRGVFERPNEFVGQIIGAVGEDSPPQHYAQILSQATGRNVVYNYMPRDDFAALGFTGAEDLANMFEFNRLYVTDRQEDLDESRKLYPQLQDFKTWADKNRDALIATLDKAG